MRHLKNKKQGMAVVIVLTLATAILILGTAFLKTIRNQGGRNTIELGAIQADLLAEGITQIAMLKFKEIPGPLYYAYVAKVQGQTDEPLKEYHKDQVLAGEFKTPFSANFQTTYQLLPSKMYDDMNIKISVVVKVTRPDGVDYERNIERTVSGVRRPAF